VLLGKLRGVRYQGMPALASSMDAVHSKVDDLLKGRQKTNEQVRRLHLMRP
jgi:hypothetical protein